jgi:hypothetical protein
VSGIWYHSGIMEDIAGQLALRDRFLKHRWQELPPIQRLKEIDELQQRSWHILKMSPQGYARFLKRNFKKRSFDYNGL